MGVAAFLNGDQAPEQAAGIPVKKNAATAKCVMDLVSIAVGEVLHLFDALGERAASRPSS